MKRFSASFYLTLFTFLGVAVPGVAQAQEVPKNLVDFKLVLNSRVNAAATFVVPLDLPRASVKVEFAGEATFLGNVTGFEHALVQQGPDGKDVSIDTIGVVNGSNGDAIFYAFRMLGHTGEGGYVITGGRGRFKGATGSGVIKAVAGTGDIQFVCTLVGKISPPTP
jgi:hypothetical protein